jgi:hypothetical protein
MMCYIGAGKPAQTDYRKTGAVISVLPNFQRGGK